MSGACRVHVRCMSGGCQVDVRWMSGACQVHSPIVVGLLLNMPNAILNRFQPAHDRVLHCMCLKKPVVGHPLHRNSGRKECFE